MKILIISGFLGAGKTTFIKSMVKATQKQFAIIENEFADLNIDGEILKSEISEENADMKIWELTEGCICCSLNLDFSNSVLTIANALNPDYLIVEPSGIAQLSKILKQLNKICYDRIELLAPVTIIDGTNYLESMRKFGDYFFDQLNSCATVIISKSEHLAPEDFQKIKNDLNISDDVTFPYNHYSSWSDGQWKKLFDKKVNIAEDDCGNANLSFETQNTISEEQILENMSIKEINIKSESALIRAMNILMSGVLGEIVRAKGHFKIGEHRVRFDYVDGKYSISGSEEMETAGAVIIGRNLKKDSIKMLFEERIIKPKYKLNKKFSHDKIRR